MHKHVSFLREIGRAELAQAGGKAANLGELTRAGFPVPAGFCVRSSGFEAFLAENRLHDSIEQIARTIDYQRLEDIEEKTARIRQTILTAPIPDFLEAEIRGAYEKLSSQKGPPLVAVRSSVATKDLSRASFPGQMDTFHNVRGVDSLLAHIRACWASVWTARAASTMHGLGLNSDLIAIAPTVQLMVPSDVSGVLFTANPVTGDTNEMLLDAAFGLGEAVVSGTLSPDHYAIRKQDGHLLSRQVGRKSFRLEFDAEKKLGNRKVFLSEKEASRECLSLEQVLELARLGVAVEKHFGEPQDVEWAYASGRLFLLQSRRIQALRGNRPLQTERPQWISEFDTPVKDPPDTYSSANISEVMPGVLSPLSLDAVKSCDYAFWKINHELGLIDDCLPSGQSDYLFIGLFYGRLHLNMSTFGRILARIPGASAADVDRPIPLDERALQSREPGFSLRKLRFLAKLFTRAIRMRLRVSAESRRLETRVRRGRAENRSRDFSTTEIRAFADLLDRQSIEGRQVITFHILNSQLAPVFYGSLRNLTRRWLGDETGAFAARLVTGLSGMESAKPAFGIYDLYRFVASSGLLTELFRETRAREILEKIQKGGTEELLEFRLRLEAFLREYGHRAVSEAEMRAPSWEEDPSYVFSMIQNYLRSPQVQSPEDIESRQNKDREAALQEASGILRSPQFLFLKFVLKEAHRFLLGRENAKALTILHLHDLKKLLRALNAKLLAANLLEKEDDIYFLTLPELAAFCRGQPIDPVSRIVRRKEEHARNETVLLPETFTGRPRPVDPGEIELPNTRVLSGLPVSPGRVTGPARVILDPRKDARLEAGEILVAPVTDTGWTPLFIMAKGLVVDVGGLLSHGSIVAREYGIPGVLNVMVATKLIKTGQIITVDGTRGEVYLHEDPSHG